MVGKLTKNGQTHALFELLNRVASKESEVPARRVLREPSVAGGDELMLIRSGLAWLYRIASGGDLQVVALRFPGEPVLPDELNSGYGVQALVESRVAAAKTRDLHSSSEGSASEILLPIVERQHRIALQWLVRGTFEATGKVAHLLCEMAIRSGQGQTHDTPISIPLTQQQIGAITGQTPINVNRILNGLQRECVLQRTGRQYIADWNALRQLGRFDPAYLL